jgi:phenylacetate-CoA ligase
MDWYTPIARHVTVPLQARREGSRWPWHVEAIRAWETLSADEIRHRQWRKMEALLAHAYEHVPYYRRTFDERGLRPADLQGFEDLHLLPVLTKHDILRHGDELVARNLPAGELVEAVTGGTTGLPMRFRRDRRSRDLHYAAGAALARWCGCNIGDRQALVWGAPQDLDGAASAKTALAGWLLRRPLALNARRISESAMARFAARLRRYRPALVRGYPSALEFLARFVLAAGERLSVPAVICTAEPLSETQRRTIEEGLGAEVFDQYGTRELGPMAMECRQHRGLHVNAFSVYLEALAEGAPGELAVCSVDDGTPSGRPSRGGDRLKPVPRTATGMSSLAGADQDQPYRPLGRLIGTDLEGYGMPLIRYDLGDLGRWETGECPCGLAFPRLAPVEGRIGSMLVGTRGAHASGTTLASVMSSRRIPGQLQFLQAEDLSVTVRVVPEPAFGASDRARIVEGVRELLGDELPVEVVEVAEIPRSASGKYIFAESRAHAAAPVPGP